MGGGGKIRDPGGKTGSVSSNELVEGKLRVDAGSCARVGWTEKIIIDNGIGTVVPISRLRNRLRTRAQTIVHINDDKRRLYPL